ncbi:hypothetical protein ACHQM5_006935 [Ranunculus cassubicifolius]
MIGSLLRLKVKTQATQPQSPEDNVDKMHGKAPISAVYGVSLAKPPTDQFGAIGGFLSYFTFSRLTSLKLAPN